MTTFRKTQESTYIETRKLLEESEYSKDPEWVRTLRDDATNRFSKLGFPIERRGNEAWKYTNVSRISKVPFKPSPVPLSTKNINLDYLGADENTKHKLVFIDGRYVEHLSSVKNLPESILVTNLENAMVSSSTLLKQHLTKYAQDENDFFTALNTAFIHEGCFVHIPDHTYLEDPIFLLFLNTGHDNDTASHPRILITTGIGSEATLIESSGSDSNARYFVNSVSEIILGENSTLKHYRVQQHSEEAYEITSTNVVLDKNASFSSVNVDLGGGLVRHNLNVLMKSEGASCTLNGLYMTTRSQHVDNQVIIDHAKGYTTANELYKGVLDGKSRTVFHGSIIVREGARKVDATQSDKNLLLSNNAEADTKPAFWIYCDDVKCAHGASCGQIDKDALFYMRSRGISEHEARGFLIRGFVSEIINSIEHKPYWNFINDLVGKTLDEWLQNRSLS